MNIRIETLYKYKNEISHILKSGITTYKMTYIKTLLYDVQEFIRKNKLRHEYIHDDLYYKDIEYLKEIYRSNSRTAIKISKNLNFIDNGILYFYECLRFLYQDLKKNNTQSMLTEWLGNNYEYVISYDFSFWDKYKFTMLDDKPNNFILFNLILSINHILAYFIAELDTNDSGKAMKYKEFANKIFENEFFKKENYLNIKIIHHLAENTYSETARYFSFGERTIRYRVKRIIDKLAGMDILYSICDSAKDEDKKVIKCINKILPFSDYFFEIFY